MITLINFDRLKEIREDHDINQNNIAKVLGISRSTYSMYECGISIIPLKYLCKFANYFGYSIDYILNLTNNRKSNNVQKQFNHTLLGNNLKRIRLKNNLSQENVANILNITQPAIAKYEKGACLISINNLYKYSKEFKISIDDLCYKKL